MPNLGGVDTHTRAGRSPEDFLTALAEDAVVFALATPGPESMPDVAAQHGSVVATDRLDFPNQINNLRAFPRIFRGALGAGVRRITAQTKVGATKAITGFVAAHEGLQQAWAF